MANVPRLYRATDRSRVRLGAAKVDLRAEVASRVRALIIAQTLEPGSHVNESKLSVTLGVSRTPLREALASLEAEHFVRYEPDRGFIVADLDVDEIRQIYPIGRELDLLALRSVELFRAETIKELRRLNASFVRAKNDAEKARKIDTQFHRLLIGGCRNERLLRMMDSIQASMARYERIYMADQSDIVRSSGQHHEIVNALERDDIEAATRVLADHWNYGFKKLASSIS